MPCLCSKLRELARQAGRSEQDEFDFQLQNLPRSDRTGKSAQRYDYDYGLDDQGRAALSSLRQKACQFIASEAEDPSRNPYHNTSQCPCVQEHLGGGSDLLRRANDLIDYTPQSEFLRRMKEQCQLLHSNQPNIFSVLDNGTVNERRRTPPKTSEYINPTRYKSDGPAKYSGSQQSRMGSSRDNEMDPRIPVERVRDRRDKLRAKGKTRTSPSDQDLEGPEGSEKKSGHMSRSKKPVKCRGRRKRKSGSSEKCESEDQFEPTLKRPHENSCERCWRFASPARSPVNKPEQKYNPNFRRGHSCLDFERAGGDLEEFDRHVSPCKHLQPIITGKEKEKSPAPSVYTVPRAPVAQPRPLSSPSQKFREAQLPSKQKAQVQFKSSERGTKGREKNSAPLRPPEIIISREPDLSIPGQAVLSQRSMYPESGRKPRPQSCIPDLPSAELVRDSDYLDHHNVTDYKFLPKNISEKQIPAVSHSHIRPHGGGSVPIEQRTENPAYSPRQSSPRPCPTTLLTIPEVADAEAVKTLRQESVSGTEEKQMKSPKNTTRRGSPKRDSPRPGTSKAKSPDRSTNGSPKKGKSKSPSPKKASPKKGATKSSKKSPKKSPTGSTKKARSSTECRQTRQDTPEIRPQTSDPSGRENQPNVNEKPYRRQPSVRSPHQYLGVDHPIRDCPCFPFDSLCLEESNPKHIMCCHCDWNKHQKNESESSRYTNRSPLGATPNYMDNRNSASVKDVPLASYQELGSRNPRGSRDAAGSAGGSLDLHNIAFEDIKGYDGRAFVCPYRERANRTPLSPAEIKLDSALEKEYQILSHLRPPSCERRSSLMECSPHKESYLPTMSTPPDQRDPIQPQESPRQRLKALVPPKKYFLFYMTKGKENKGDEVDVLVEELGCPDKTDSRTKDITEKMKKIMECPSESMALRFQKGISEACRIPQSSRILYF